MTEARYTIKDELGIHARPAGFIVREARKYSSTVQILSRGQTANGKNLISLMKLVVKHGDLVIVQIEGIDETDANHAIGSIFQKYLC
ncbi:MAG: HPr family phosphocarrier protein [Treponema sp.]|jgi:phosphocarrier protein|nr:HPr family phosphocarrier protein [Treponema sp.]